MSIDESAAHYAKTVAALIRQMPLAEAIPFLTGAVAVSGDHPAMKDLRGTLVDLRSADDQLELLAGPQMRLAFTPEGTR